MGAALPAVYVSGTGFWSPALPGWGVARATFAGGGAPVEGGVRRPSPALLPPAERRRVPDTVAVALEAASEALAASGLAAADLPSVFASAYGDLAGTDALCAALAEPAPMLSPTRFHNAVHNAAAGYWSIATGARCASNAVSAFDRSFAAGLLEAATLCVADATPVLLVGFDGPATGALAQVARSTGLLAAAMVITPGPVLATTFALELGIETVGGSPTPAQASPIESLLRSAAARTLGGNAMADALPLCEALAAGTPAAWRQPLSDRSALTLRLTPYPETPR
jgi:hypothetical protein